MPTKRQRSKMTKREYKDRYELRIPNGQKAPRLCPELAQEIGLNESIMLLQIDFLVGISGTEQEDGEWWAYESITDLIEEFPFWSRSTINRIINKLEKNEYIIVGNFNKFKYDKTRWFRLNRNKISKLESISLIHNLTGKLYQSEPQQNQYETRTTQNDTGSMQNGTTIPDSSPDFSSENNASRVSPNGDNLIGIKVVEPKDIQTEYIEIPLYEYANELICPECNHHQEWPKSNRERKKKSTLTCQSCGLLWKVTISYDTGGNDIYKSPLPRQEWIILLDDSIPNIGNRLVCDENECKQFVANWQEDCRLVVKKLQWAAGEDWLKRQRDRIVSRVNAAYETTMKRLKAQESQLQKRAQPDYSKLETIEPDWMEL